MIDMMVIPIKLKVNTDPATVVIFAVFSRATHPVPYADSSNCSSILSITIVA